MIDWINTLILHLLVIPTTLFPVLYALRSNWRSTEEGRAVMVSSIGLALLVDISVVGRYLHVADGWASDLVVMAVLLTILAGSVSMLILLLRAQHKARH